MYTMTLAPLFFAALAVAMPTTLMHRRDNITCPTLHVIVARGTCESPTQYTGMGYFRYVAQMITSQINGSDSIGLDYPATGMTACPTPNYKISQPAGVTNLTNYIASYTTMCPDTKLTLVGFSQGGQVVGDTICGASEVGFPATKPLAHKYAKKIVAAITFGDPARVMNTTYDMGTDLTSNGIYPRTYTAPCKKFAAKYQAYCNANDEFCASGTSLAVHGAYVATNGAQGAAFVAAQYAASLLK